MEQSKRETPRIGVFACHCGINIGGVVKVPEVVEYTKTARRQKKTEKQSGVIEKTSKKFDDFCVGRAFT